MMDRVTSLIKALDLLTLLAGEVGGYTIQELADGMNQPRSTVVRVLNTLVDYGLVVRRGHRYLASEAFNAWSRCNRHQFLRLRYRKILEAVAAKVSELVLLGVQEGAGIVHIDFIESDQAVRVAPAPDTRHNIRHNAIGKLCIAQRSDLEGFWTQADPEFKYELEEIRKTGIAWNREESVPGMIALACYGLGRSPTEPKLAVAWPIHRFTETKAAKAAEAINRALEDSAGN